MRPLPGPQEPSDPFPEDELETYHSPEPWRQEGRYIRDASGAIVVRGRTAADARRIAAAINATRDIPTDALENWHVQDVSDPRTRPDLEVSITDEATPSAYIVRPPDALRTSPAGARLAPDPFTSELGRRSGERRRGERREPISTINPETLFFDRRVMDRRFGERRGQ